MKDAYSYPEICDIAYDWDRAPECDFIEKCAAMFSDNRVCSVLDIACGTGIHLREFARRGYAAYGIDRSPEMASYVGQRALYEGLDTGCAVADMGKFTSARIYSIAICMLDSFRYLLTDAGIISHLASVSDAIEAGGIYFIDLWMPSSGRPIEWEDVAWSQERAETRVDARYVQHADTFDPSLRTFEDELIFKASGAAGDRTVTSRAETRFLEREEFYTLVERQGSFEPAGFFYNFDFDNKGVYNIKQIRTNLILKKRR